MSPQDLVQYKYIEFIRHDIMGRKTLVYHCRNIKSGDVLGWVQWSGAWRQYCFYPEGNTVFSASCLQDICAFIGTLMHERGKS